MICPSCQKAIADNSRFCYLCGAQLLDHIPALPPAVAPRRLYRSATNKKIGGVCGGLAEYMELDASVVRVIVFLLMVLTGVGLFAYLVAWMIIPLDPEAVPPAVAGRPHRLYRSATDRKIAGVCGGLAEYLDVDSTVVRVIWLLATLSFFPFLAYLLLWFVTPLAETYPAGSPAAVGTPST